MRGAHCGLCAPPAPTELGFLSPVTKETKGPVFFPKHKIGFFFSTAKTLPPPLHTHTLPGLVLAALWGHSGFGG